MEERIPFGTEISPTQTMQLARGLRSLVQVSSAGKAHGAPRHMLQSRPTLGGTRKFTQRWIGSSPSSFATVSRFYTTKQAPQHDKHPLFQQAMREMREKTPLACLETCLRILKDEPTNPIVNLFAAASRFFLREYEACIPHLEKVILVRPRDLEAHHLKGQALHKMGQPTKALLYFDSALKINDRHISTITSRAAILEELGRYEDAAAAFRKASLIQRTWTSCFRAAECYFAVKLYREALEYYDLALETYKFEPAVYIGKAKLLTETGKTRSAVETLDELLYEVPDEPRSLFAKALILHTHMNEHQKALTITNTLLEKGHDEDIALLTLKAKCLQQLKQYPESLDIFDKILLRTPQDAEALRARADILSALGSPDAADAKAQAEAIEGKESETLVEDGAKYWKQGQFDKALVCYEKIAKYTPDLPVAHLGRGVALTHLGRTKEAKSALQYAVALQPKMPIAHYYLGKIFAAQNEFESAIKSYKKAFKQQPENIDAILQVAQLHEKLKEFDEAIDAYDEVLEAEPENEVAKKAKLNILRAANSL